MKLETFQIHFENDRGVFASGECVRGEVIIKLAQPMKMRILSIYFEGRAKSHWEVRHGRSKTDYRANEGYIQHTIKLYGEGQQTVEHPAGLHKYPFSLAIAPNLPSSFEGRRGYVRYFCKATINRPWKFDEHIKRPFTVIHHLDLNFVPTAGIQIVGEEEQTIESCCCSSGTVTGKLTLNKTGYVPGEPVNFTIDVFNKSDTNVESIGLELKQVVTYTGYSDSIFSSGNAKQHTKLDTFCLLTQGCRIKQNMEEHISRGAVIPALPPSGLQGCGIIDIQYSIMMKANIGWTSLTIERGILIGTIPIHQPQQVSNFGPAPFTPTSVPSAPPAIEPPPYSEPPPTYEESVFGRTEIRDENDDVHTSGLAAWAPSYPYYNWNLPAGGPPAVGTPAAASGAPITMQPQPTAPPPAYNQI